MLSIFGNDSRNCSYSQNSSAYNVNSPPNLVRCTYALSPKSQSCSGNNGGIEATALICQNCACQEIRINGSPPSGDDPCFTRIPKRGVNEQCRGGDGDDSTCKSQTESCASRRKNYILPQNRRCAPYCGYLSEYQDAYRKRPPGMGPRTRERPLRVLERPEWNNSIQIPPKPYQETLEAAEAKLKSLDMFEDPSHDIMALAIIREQVKEKYRATRSGGWEPETDDCCAEAVSRLRGGIGGSTCQYNYPFRPRPARPTAFIKGDNLELVEQESLLSEI